MSTRRFFFYSAFLAAGAALVGLVIGLVIGANVGLLVCALCVAARTGDAHLDYLKNHKEDA